MDVWAGLVADGIGAIGFGLSYTSQTKVLSIEACEGSESQ